MARIIAQHNSAKQDELLKRYNNLSPADKATVDSIIGILP